MYTNSSNEKDQFDALFEDWKSIYSDIDVYSTRIVGRLVEVSKILGSSELYRSEIVVLSNLYRAGVPFQLSPSQLIQQVGLSSGAMTALLNRIEKKGYIIRKPDNKDGRVSSAVLTPKGIEFIHEVVGLQLNHNDSIISIFDDFEKRQFAQLLKKMLKHLNEKEL
jgi:DNA-binding MarR family transcriptional regulator